MHTDFEHKRALARHFIQCYIAARQGLTTLGVLRSERTLQGDYAEWLVAELLEIQLATSTIQKAYDAHDTLGHTYQIKSRIVPTVMRPTSFDFAATELQFTYLVAVFFSPMFEVLGMIRVPVDVVRELGVPNTKSFRFRWNRRIAADPRIERIIWTSDPPVMNIPIPAEEDVDDRVA
jgi:hypothetical protein